MSAHVFVCFQASIRAWTGASLHTSSFASTFPGHCLHGIELSSGRTSRHWTMQSLRMHPNPGLHNAHSERWIWDSWGCSQRLCGRFPMAYTDGGSADSAHTVVRQAAGFWLRLLPCKSNAAACFPHPEDNFECSNPVFKTDHCVGQDSRTLPCGVRQCVNKLAASAATQDYVKFQPAACAVSGCCNRPN